MKRMNFSLAALALLSLAPRHALANDFSLSCIENKELKFEIFFSNNKPKELIFSKEGGGSDMSNDLLGVSVALEKNPIGPNDQKYTNYVGEAKVRDTDSFYRTVEVSYENKELEKSEKIVIEIAPGNSHWAGDASDTYTPWAFVCKKVTR